MVEALRRRLPLLAWIVLAVPGLYQVTLLVATTLRRFSYPYDLEWMEGGLLTHALQYTQGLDLYRPPSVEFIPYLYTPLYPALLAGMEPVFGLSYQTGRAVSLLSMAAVLALLGWAVWREGRASVSPGPRVAAAACALGFFAATYPWVEGWYDLVRADTLFLALGLGGVALLHRACEDDRPGWWHPRAAVAGAILALSFFTKQTGVLLVAAGGAAVLFLRWRALPTYAAAAGILGLGGTFAYNTATDGWFWTYIFRVHQQHDTNADRFFLSFKNIFLQFPVMTAAIVVGLVVLAVFFAQRRRLPDSARGFLFWAWMFLCGTVIGAIGWATQWAHFNAYIPAMTFGAAAAGCAVAPITECVQAWLGDEDRHRLPALAAAALVIALGTQLFLARWSPRAFVPAERDRQAGDRLVARLAATDGEVLIPFHPWYAHLAGKPTYVHRMGILDVTYVHKGKRPLPAAARTVAGLEDAIREKRFALIVLDNRARPGEIPFLHQAYRKAGVLPGDERPRVFTGAKTVPQDLWVPK